MDSDHIDPASLDENGTAEGEDDRGRTFDIHIKSANTEKYNEDGNADNKDDENENADPNQSETDN